MATLIKADGMEEPFVIDKEKSLLSMQTAVGGFIELLRSADGTKYLICNEEGKINLPFNQKATEIWVGDQGHFIQDVLCGDVIVCEKKEFVDTDKETEL